jgi:hypothetical protein
MISVVSTNNSSRLFSTISKIRPTMNLNERSSIEHFHLIG